MKKIKRSEQILQKNFFERNKTEILLFLALFLTYGYFSQGGGWNQNARMDLVRSIVEQKTFFIDSYVQNTGDWSRFGGHYYPNKPPGSSFIGIPIYFLIYQVEKLSGVNFYQRFFLNLNGYLLTLFSVSLLSSILGVIFYRFLFFLSTNQGERISLTLAYSLGTLAFPYSTLFYGHQIAAFLAFLAFYLLFKIKRTESLPEKIVRSYLIVSGFLSGLAVLMEYTSLVVTGFFILYLFIFLKRKTIYLGFFGLGFSFPIFLLLRYNFVCFENPFSTGLAYQNPLWLKGTQTFYGFVFPKLMTFLQLTFLPYRGLFFTSPILLLSIPGFLYISKIRNLRAEFWLSLSIVLFYFLLNASFYTWEGGWACGPRYMIPMLPFLVVPIIYCFKKFKKITYFLVFVSIFFMFAITAVRPEVPSFVKNPLFDYVLPNFFNGELSLNLQGLNELFPGMLYRLNSTEAQFNSFNLGELLPMHGLTSLVPLLFIWIIFYLWLPKDRNNTSFDIQKKGDKQ